MNRSTLLSTILFPVALCPLGYLSASADAGNEEDCALDPKPNEFESTDQHKVVRRGDTRYDQNGRIVFTASKGLPGVGFSRAEWDAIKHMTAGTVQRTITDTTLPTGPVERTITYQAPLTKRNREQDHAMVWAVLDELA